MTYGLIAAGWFVGFIFAALIFGRAISNADRNCDSEESTREPVSERPTQILVISNHSGGSK